DLAVARGGVHAAAIRANIRRDRSARLESVVAVLMVDPDRRAIVQPQGVNLAVAATREKKSLENRRGRRKLSARAGHRGPLGDGHVRRFFRADRDQTPAVDHLAADENTITLAHARTGDRKIERE